MKTIGRQLQEQKELVARMIATAEKAEKIFDKYQEDIETLLCQNDAGKITSVDEEYIANPRTAEHPIYKVTIYTDLSDSTQEQLNSIYSGLFAVEEFGVWVKRDSIEITLNF